MKKQLNKFWSSDHRIALVGQFYASAFGLLSFALIARWLDKESFGTYTIFISLVGLFDLMRNGLIRPVLVRLLSLSDHSKSEVIGTGWLMNLISALFLIIMDGLVLIAYSNTSFDLAGIQLFLQWYPLTLLVSLTHQFDTWMAQGQGNLHRMNRIRLGINVIVLLSLFYLKDQLNDAASMVVVYIIANGLVSVYCLISFRSIQFILSAKSSILKNLLKNGKNTWATAAGSNLLKSSDALVIGVFIGAEATASYALPMKVLDLIEIPLRALSLASYRKLVLLYKANNIQSFHAHLTRMVGMMSIGCLLIGTGIWIFPDHFIRILGGSGFESSSDLLILMVIPILLMPLDRYLGVSLDAVGMHKLNATKVWWMVLINLTGDLIVLQFATSLWPVVVVTILNIMGGILYGLYFHPVLNRALLFNDRQKVTIRRMITFQRLNSPYFSLRK
jgi:O-antigen/teichoic acid export membrane protein